MVRMCPSWKIWCLVWTEAGMISSHFLNALSFRECLCGEEEDWLETSMTQLLTKIGGNKSFVYPLWLFSFASAFRIQTQVKDGGLVWKMQEAVLSFPIPSNHFWLGSGFQHYWFIFLSFHLLTNHNKMTEILDTIFLEMESHLWLDYKEGAPWATSEEKGNVVPWIFSPERMAVLGLPLMRKEIFYSIT